MQGLSNLSQYSLMGVTQGRDIYNFIKCNNRFDICIVKCRRIKTLQINTKFNIGNICLIILQDT